MENSTQPAFGYGFANQYKQEQYNGLTKREYFAAMFMQVIISNRELQLALYKDIPVNKKIRQDLDNNNFIAIRSLEYADELLKQLEQK